MSLGAGAAAAEPTEFVRRGAFQQAEAPLKCWKLAPRVHRWERLGLHRLVHEVVVLAASPAASPYSVRILELQLALEHLWVRLRQHRPVLKVPAAWSRLRHSLRQRVATLRNHGLR